MLIALTSLAFEIAAERARCLILKTEHELSVVGDASDKIGVAYFLIGRCEPSSDLSFFTTSRSTPHPLRILAGLSPRQGLGSRVRFANTSLSLIAYEMRSKMYCAWPPNRLGGCYILIMDNGTDSSKNSDSRTGRGNGSSSSFSPEIFSPT